MSAKDLRFWLKNFWKDFRKERSGLVGIIILSLSIFVVVFEPLLLPWSEVNTRWRDIDYWRDNSASAPPSWTNLLRAKKASTTEKVKASKPEELELDGGIKMIRYEFEYDFTADEPPLDAIIHGLGSGDLPLTFSVQRPDGETIELAQRFERGLAETDVRFSLGNDARDAAFGFLKSHDTEQNLSALSPGAIDSPKIIFNETHEGMSSTFKALKGIYKFEVAAMILDPENSHYEKPYVIVSGSVSGLLGTDNMKRDIFSGLLAGLKWALLIGLLTSFVSVLIGVFYGIISAYYGGIVDTIMQFIFQLFNGIPLLPVLIVVSAIFKPSIWFIIGVMTMFFWTGSVMTVRSMAFQIKEGTYIEAAKALGAKNRRIIFKHMAPLLLPYSFASMALSVPSAIVYESTISLLGLGDASIVTWGQILHDAMAGGAILNGVWWWIIPPGLLIAVMGMTFAFIGFAMDKILHPKLRTR